MIQIIHMIRTHKIVGHIFGANSWADVGIHKYICYIRYTWYMIQMIHMINTQKIVGHIFGENLGNYTNTFVIHETLVPGGKEGEGRGRIFDTLVGYCKCFATSEKSK